MGSVQYLQLRELDDKTVLVIKISEGKTIKQDTFRYVIINKSPHGICPVFHITNQPLGFDLKTGYLFRAVDKSNGTVLNKPLTLVLGGP